MLYIYLHDSFSKVKALIVSLNYKFKHRNCFICQQSSLALICDYCVRDAVLPLFPSPGHNLLAYDAVYKHLAQPHYEELHAIGAYSGILSGLINKLKFASTPLAANVMAALFHQYLHQRLSLYDSLPDALVPIPLSKWRYVGRQYNQARIIAQALGELFDIPVIDVLIRTKHTQQQSRLNKDQRLNNIHAAFALNKTIKLDSVAIVDDVITTGATVNEASRLLHSHYPDLKISVWTMAVALKS